MGVMIEKIFMKLNVALGIALVACSMYMLETVIVDPFIGFGVGVVGMELIYTSAKSLELLNNSIYDDYEEYDDYDDEDDEEWND